jgi:murein DD-endopeptidase MepM/ murein hydrolase activator NlpD
MNRLDFMRSMVSPLPNAVLKKYPNGNIMQLWGENPTAYSSAFGQHDDVHRYLGGHSGIDISTGYGDTVVAAHDGVVEAIDTNPADSGGIQIKLTSDPLDGEEVGNSKIETVYCHLKGIVVTAGQRVRQGDPIGYEGNTGFVISGGTSYWGNAPAGAGTHLHFGLHELILHTVGGVSAWMGRYQNPMMGTSDPLYYLTGDTAGEVNVLHNILDYIKAKFGWA